MNNKLNWSDLPVFLAVIESGSLSNAAKSLNLSQPTVGRRISALEEQMGAPLLKKTNSGLVATDLGVSVLEQIKLMTRSAEAISRTTAAQEQTLAGDITISASQGIGDVWLPAVLEEIHQQYPEINFKIDVNAEPANLAKREADIALRWKGPGNQNSLIARKVITTGFGLYASKNYLQKNGRPLVTQDLKEHIGLRVQFNKNNDNNPHWPVNLAVFQVPPKKIALVSNSFRTHEVAIEGGFGIGSLAHIQAAHLENVERVLPDYESFVDLWIVAHDDLSRNKRIRLVFDFLIKVLQKDQEVFLTGSTDNFAK
jgi:DNA-binding transcriptional LysR family regulator